MDPLVSKIKTAIETQFQAKLVNLQIDREGDMWGIQFGSPMDSFTITVECIKSRHKLMNGEMPAHDISTLWREDIITPALGDNGRLMQISTNMDSHSNFRTKLTFVTHDLEAFANCLHDLVYKNYSKEFDAIMTETLLED